MQWISYHLTSTIHILKTNKLMKILCIFILIIRKNQSLSLMHCDYYWLLKVFYPPKNLFDLPQRRLFFLQKYFLLQQYNFPIVFNIVINSKIWEKEEVMQKHVYYLSRSYLTLRRKKTTQAICERTIFSF